MDITEFARLGGQARASKLSASRRKEIAVNAINKRWNKKTVLASKYEEPKDFEGCAKCDLAETLHPKYTKHEYITS